MKLYTSLLLLGLVSMLSFVASVMIPSGEGESHMAEYSLSLSDLDYVLVLTSVWMLGKDKESTTMVNLMIFWLLLVNDLL